MKDVVSMHKVKCKYCGKTFDRDKYPFVQISAQRYAHKECALEQEKKIIAEDEDKKNLEEYIMKLLNISYVDPKIRKQIKQYVEEYQYTYSGIHKTLVYFYEVKGNSIDKANGGIGIVPYIYQESFRYYYALWENQQRNVGKEAKDYIPTVKEIIIPVPQRNIKKKNRFSFLDEEEVNDGK